MATCQLPIMHPIGSGLDLLPAVNGGDSFSAEDLSITVFLNIKSKKFYSELVELESTEIFGG